MWMLFKVVKMKVIQVYTYCHRVEEWIGHLCQDYGATDSTMPSSKQIATMTKILKLLLKL